MISPSGPLQAALVSVAFAVVAYLIGGISWALLIGKWVGHVDLRTVGSGNLGSTNVARFLGGKWAVAVFALDFLKGFVPVMAAALLVAPQWRDLVMVTTSVAAILGHVYSPYLGFRGGKGIATTAGVAAALFPWTLLVGAIAFFAVAVPSRRVSLGSLAIGLVAAPATWILYPGRPLLLAVALVITAIIFWSHRSNIRRLLKGEEPKVSWGIWKDREAG